MNALEQATWGSVHAGLGRHHSSGSSWCCSGLSSPAALCHVDRAALQALGWALQRPLRVINGLTADIADIQAVLALIRSCSKDSMAILVLQRPNICFNKLSDVIKQATMLPTLLQGMVNLVCSCRVRPPACWICCKGDQPPCWHCCGTVRKAFCTHHSCSE